MLDTAIMSIGDEICIGQIVNTNAAWLAKRITETGANVTQHSTIGDEKNIMLDELQKLMQTNRIVIITGGLGPTHDDITKPCLTEYFNDTLKLHEPTLRHLEKLFKERGYEMNDRNRNIAMLPSKCTPLFNSAGTAPGMLFEKSGNFVFSLPGVPSEMKAITEEHIIPFIKDLLMKEKQDVRVYKTWQTIGIVESLLADKLGEIEEFPVTETSLAYLPSYKGVRLRAGINAATREEAVEKLKKIEGHVFSRVGEFIYGQDEENIINTVAKLLTDRDLTVAVAESCTGGMLGAAFTDIPGSSRYFLGGMLVYSNEIKEKHLKVSADTLQKFGAVSRETASEMSQNICSIFGSDIGIGITGIAGPDGGTEEKPVGTVWISITYKNKTFAKRYVFGSKREINRERSVGTALGMLYKILRDDA